MYSSDDIQNRHFKIIIIFLYNCLIFSICYSCNVVIKLNGKIPSQVLHFLSVSDYNIYIQLIITI